MKTGLILLLFIIPLITFSQTITVSKTKVGAFIEYRNYNDNATGYYGSFGFYWVTNNTVQRLQIAMNKAIDWAELNRTKLMAFEKEIIRFRTMDKKEYEFYQKFVPEFSQEAIVYFIGFGDGSFNCKISFDSCVITFNNTEEIKNFINLLQGKSGNSKVDDIFH